MDHHFRRLLRRRRPSTPPEMRHSAGAVGTSRRDHHVSSGRWCSPPACRPAQPRSAATQLLDHLWRVGPGGFGAPHRCAGRPGLRSRGLVHQETPGPSPAERCRRAHAFGWGGDRSSQVLPTYRLREDTSAEVISSAFRGGHAQGGAGAPGSAPRGVQPRPGRRLGPERSSDDKTA